MISQTGTNLVFVLGLPRSGTTLLCTLLANHPRVICPPEPWLMLALHAVGRTATAHPADSRLLATALGEFLTADLAREARRAFAVSAYNRTLTDAGGDVLIDKTPRYFHVLDEIADLFPDARHLWIQRDPLDVAASYQSSWGVDVATVIDADIGHPVALDLVLGLRRLEAFTRVHGERVLALRYEDLVADAEGVLRRSLAFLELDEPPDLARLDGLELIRNAAMGDRKILDTTVVHDRSVGTGLATLSTLELQTLHDALGGELVERFCREGTTAELRRSGVADRGPAITAEIVARAEHALAERWREVLAPPEVHTIGQLTDAMSTRAEQAESELSDLRVEHERLARGHERQDRKRREERALVEEARLALEHRREWANMPARRKVVRSIRQLALSVVELVGPGRGNASLTMSIITPLVTPEPRLGETLRSVTGQRYGAVEHIIAGPGELLERIEIGDDGPEPRLVPTASGIDRIDAINAGLDAASGEVLTWLDPGDTLEPDTLHRVEDVLRRRPRAQAVHLDATLRVGGWRFPEPPRPPADLFAALAGNPAPRGGVFVRRCPFQSIRTLDETRPLAAEQQLWLALTRWFRLARAPGHGRCVLFHDDPVTEDERRQLDETRAEFRRSMRWIGHLRRLPRAAGRRVGRGPRRPKRWFYPLEPHAGLSTFADAGVIGAAGDAGPINRRVDRLLFTWRDDDHRPPVFRRVYVSDSTGVAWRWPPAVEPATTSKSETAWASDDQRSPYRGYSGSPRLARVLRKIETRSDGGRTSTNDGRRGPPDADSQSSTIRFGHRSGDEEAPDAVPTATVAWTTLAEAPFTTPVGRQFDLVDVGPDASLGPEPAAAVRRLLTLLLPGGRLRLMIPNLDSAQLEMFGPTWSLWQHPSQETYMLPRALPLLVQGTDLRLLKVRTSSDLRTTARSLRINATGLDAFLPWSWRPEPDAERRARALVSHCHRHEDARGRGDWMAAVFERR